MSDNINRHTRLEDVMSKLPPRVGNCLKHGYWPKSSMYGPKVLSPTLGELAEISSVELMRTPNFGLASLRSWHEFLLKHKIK